MRTTLTFTRDDLVALARAEAERVWPDHEVVPESDRFSAGEGASLPGEFASSGPWAKIQIEIRPRKKVGSAR